MRAALRPAASLLEPDFAAVLHAADRVAYRERIIQFAKKLGFDRVTAFCAIDRANGGTDFDGIDNAPAGFRPEHGNAAAARTDPVMQYCKHHSLPIVWDQQTYLDTGKIDLWEVQARFGYRCGIAVALHMPGGRHYMLGVDRDRPLTRDPIQITRIVASVQLFAVHANEADRQVRSQPQQEPDAKLTRRELELLRLTAAGMTAQQAGDSLGISDRTAAFHLMRATRKLRCANKLQAAVNAVRLGLVQL